MAVMDVVKWPAQVLETPAEPVTVFDDELRRLASDMHETMDAADGIGLAANQVNILKQIIVIHIPWHDPEQGGERPKKPWHKRGNTGKKPWHDRRFTLINPDIVECHGEVHALEGCLSFPGNMDYIGRHAEVTVSYQDLAGDACTLSCGGLMSVCLQHEIDHLRGVVFLERMDERVAEKIRQKILA